MSDTTVVAVIDATDMEAIVWHVDTGPGGDLGRLCGAWVIRRTDRRFRTLVQDRFVLTTAAGREVLLATGVPHLGKIEIAEVLANLAECCATLQTAYEAHQIRRSVKLVPPNWPSLPTDSDLSEIRPAGEDPTVARALGIARWLVDASVAWAQIEQQRLARPYLAQFGGPEARPLALTS